MRIASVTKNLAVAMTNNSGGEHRLSCRKRSREFRKSVDTPLKAVSQRIRSRSARPGALRDMTNGPAQGKASTSKGYPQQPLDYSRCGEEYSQEIYHRHRRDEHSHQVPKNHLAFQDEIDGEGRAIVVDWLVHIETKHRMRPQTLYMAINIIDRYLSKARVKRDELQLVGIAAMSLAAKFEELTTVKISAWTRIAKYASEEIIHMEHAIFKTLGFELRVPTAAHFLNFFIRANRSDEGQHKELIRYLVELALVENHMAHYRPSLIVAAATMLSNQMTGRQFIWPASIMEQSGYTDDDIRSCAHELRLIHRAAPRNPNKAVRQRYLQPDHYVVASTYVD